MVDHLPLIVAAQKIIAAYDKACEEKYDELKWGAFHSLADFDDLQAAIKRLTTKEARERLESVAIASVDQNLQAYNWSRTDL